MSVIVLISYTSMIKTYNLPTKKPNANRKFSIGMPKKTCTDEWQTYATQNHKRLSEKYASKWKVERDV